MKLKKDSVVVFYEADTIRTLLDEEIENVCVNSGTKGMQADIT